MDNFTKVLFSGIDGISLDFLLIIPNDMNNEKILILNGVTPNTGTGSSKDNPNFGTYEDAYKAARMTAENMWFSPDYKRLLFEYNNPMLIPIIPRCNGLYTGYLGYNVYHEIYDNALKVSKFTENDFNKFRGLDKQIEKMIIYSIDYINENYNLNLDYKVIATGYSASSKMVNFFAALHPDLVKMVIGGGTAGLTIIPTLEYDYPLGFKDLPRENLEKFKSIPQFYYMGKEDTLDPSRPRYEKRKLRDENGKYVLDENGKPTYLYDERGNSLPEMKDGMIKFIYDDNGDYILPNGGYFSLEQTHILYDGLYPTNTQERFDYNALIYKSEGVNAIFKKYNGNHDINDENLSEDIIAFYNDNCIRKANINSRSK